MENQYISIQNLNLIVGIVSYVMLGQLPLSKIYIICCKTNERSTALDWNGLSRIRSRWISMAGEMSWSKSIVRTSPVIKWESVPDVTTYAFPWFSLLKSKAASLEIRPSGRQKAIGPGRPSENDDVSTSAQLTWHPLVGLHGFPEAQEKSKPEWSGGNKQEKSKPVALIFSRMTTVLC